MSDSSNATKVPEHAPMHQFEVVDNCLHIGGQPLTALADRVGKTPFYAYDRAVINAQVDALRGALPPRVHLHYAIKANPKRESIRPASALPGLENPQKTSNWPWPAVSSSIWNHAARWSVSPCLPSAAAGVHQSQFVSIPISN